MLNERSCLLIARILKKKLQCNKLCDILQCKLVKNDLHYVSVSLLVGSHSGLRECAAFARRDRARRVVHIAAEEGVKTAAAAQQLSDSAREMRHSREIYVHIPKFHEDCARQHKQTGRQDERCQAVREPSYRNRSM